MSLKIRLKAHEKILIGHAVIKNGDRPSEFQIENTVSILREKDIMQEHAATSPARRLYFLVQLMYVDGENLVAYDHAYWELAGQIQEAAPSTEELLAGINARVMNHDYYHALKCARKLIDYEDLLLSRLTASVAEHA